ncbi:MAG TPA: OB-fold domain-containing protein [Acidimicrobiales bacterium]
MTTLKAQKPGIPVGVPSPLTQPYWDACARGELVYQRCEACGLILERPSTVCGACLGRKLSWARSSGRGELYSWTVVWRPQHPAFEVPYAPAIVALDEGWYHVAAVIGCEPEDLRAGMRLAVEFHPASDEITLPYYRPI